ncbi:MAG: hypothetical protein LUC21_00845, partial [Oscillospiraceae bacterium]|nr:hypothetical protein [Oscillospiraceae bacterium]
LCYTPHVKCAVFFDRCYSSTLGEYAENIVLNWKNSPGHNAVLLDSSFDYIGCGVDFPKTGSAYCATHYTTHGQIKDYGFAAFD